MLHSLCCRAAPDVPIARSGANHLSPLSCHRKRTAWLFVRRFPTQAAMIQYYLASPSSLHAHARIALPAHPTHTSFWLRLNSDRSAICTKHQQYISTIRCANSIYIEFRIRRAYREHHFVRVELHRRHRLNRGACVSGPLCAMGLHVSESAYWLWTALVNRVDVPDFDNTRLRATAAAREIDQHVLTSV